MMMRCRVSDFNSERVLGHVIPGESGTYTHDDDGEIFMEQKREALERLAAEIQRLVDPPDEDKVVDIRKAAE